jgi:hypothetical protein
MSEIIHIGLSQTKIKMLELGEIVADIIKNSRIAKQNNEVRNGKKN